VGVPQGPVKSGGQAIVGGVVSLTVKTWAGIGVAAGVGR
jgi:hypothetical protein